MRLIDADALMHTFSDEVETAFALAGFPIRSNVEAIVCGYTMGAIAEAQTIDAVPVVHGQWITGLSFKLGEQTLFIEKCSICGKILNRAKWMKKASFCPSCGAKMDKEDKPCQP